MNILTKEALADLIIRGYRYATIEDFSIADGKTTLVIRPLRSTAIQVLSRSITSLTDPIITTQINRDGAVVIYVL